MKNSMFIILTSLIISLVISSCDGGKEKADVTTANHSTIDLEDNKKEFVELMQKHLDAVTNRDLKSLSSTMSPDGTMQLILPESEIIEGVDGFLEYHKEWFKDTTWNFSAKILNVEVGNTIGMAITEILYEEPERKGKPYYNIMIVSYDLKKIDGKWTVIKDHASSVEKSTDVPK